MTTADAAGGATAAGAFFRINFDAALLGAFLPLAAGLCEALALALLVLELFLGFFGARFLTAFFAFFLFFFLATPRPPAWNTYSRGANHTIASVANRSEARVRVASGPSGLTVEIRPLVRTRRGRVRFALLAAAVLVGALLGASRIVQGWETSLRRGEFTEFPLPLLASLSVAIGVFAPLALVGLAALAFAEETVEVSAETLTIRTTAFEKTRIRRIPLVELECWRETYLPLAPWWTWAVQRLAARWRGKLEPLAGAAGPKEKREIARILARATGKPLVNDFGRARS